MANFVKILYYKKTKNSSRDILKDDYESPYITTINVDNIDNLTGPIDTEIHIFDNERYSTYTRKDLNVIQIYTIGGWIFLCPGSEYEKIINFQNDFMVNN